MLQVRSQQPARLHAMVFVCFGYFSSSRGCSHGVKPARNSVSRGTLASAARNAGSRERWTITANS